MYYRRRLQALALYPKIFSFKTPPYLSCKIRYRTDVHNLLTRFRGKLSLPPDKSSLYQFSFYYQIYACYIGFPEHLVSGSLGLFKNKMRQLIFAE